MEVRRESGGAIALPWGWKRRFVADPKRAISSRPPTPPLSAGIDQHNDARFLIYRALLPLVSLALFSFKHEPLCLKPLLCLL